MSRPKSDREPVSFVAFFLIWAELQGWKVPMLHIRICDWLENERARVRVLEVFRGAAKSTIFACYKAWLLRENPTLRSLIWSADDDVAGKLTSDTLNILRRHPLCKGMISGKPGVFAFRVDGATDFRNPSMEAHGINSNATGSRCDYADFDDVEVPKNIKTADARKQIRDKISESTHILVPTGRKTYIGTPHTTDSIYDEQIEGGASTLIIPLFAQVRRHEGSEVRKQRVYALPFDPMEDGYTVISGIHKQARILQEGIDYTITGKDLLFRNGAPGVSFDICTGSAWPEYFTPDAIQFKRSECRTYNEWDSQYLLKSRPMNEVRLDPSLIKTYDTELELRTANGETRLLLGPIQIVGMSCRWDPSSGKLKSDASSVSVVLQDSLGRRYWHRAVELKGQIAEYDESGRDIVGGQVLQLVELIIELSIPRVSVETNGIGAFAPSVLRAALAQKKARCGVVEVLAPSDSSKNKRILEAIEGPLTSGMLYAHKSALRPDVREQMRDWSPATADQKDDHLDSVAGAITETPERLTRLALIQGGLNEPRNPLDAWRPSSEGYLAEVDYL